MASTTARVFSTVQGLAGILPTGGFCALLLTVIFASFMPACSVGSLYLPAAFASWVFLTPPFALFRQSLTLMF
jgi:hypothetical protein